MFTQSFLIRPIRSGFEINNLLLLLFFFLKHSAESPKHIKRIWVELFFEFKKVCVFRTNLQKTDEIFMP